MLEGLRERRLMMHTLPAGLTGIFDFIFFSPPSRPGFD